MNWILICHSPLEEKPRALGAGRMSSAYMDRRQIERVTASLAVILLTVITTGAILAFANNFFRWDIFPPDIEKILWFIFVSLLAIMVASVLVNIMINISIIALNSERKAHKEE
ncbi:MAG: hypothetical protein HYW33_01675 [Candidatus Blackburnbacteria bacterium]|nr:hypothetical protein [Candidatus Blackburnbacteria bacterium]